MVNCLPHEGYACFSVWFKQEITPRALRMFKSWGDLYLFYEFRMSIKHTQKRCKKRRHLELKRFKLIFYMTKDDVRMSEADTVGLILVLILMIIFAMVGLYEITFEGRKSRRRRGIATAFTLFFDLKQP